MSESPEGIDAIKQRKMAEMQRRITENDQAEQEKKAIEGQKQNLLRVILTPEARSRLNNLKIVRPEFAEQLELQLIELAQQRRLPVPLGDEQLKKILSELQGRKRDIRITRM